MRYACIIHTWTLGVRHACMEKDKQMSLARTLPLGERGDIVKNLSPRSTTRYLHLHQSLFDSLRFPLTPKLSSDTSVPWG